MWIQLQCIASDGGDAGVVGMSTVASVFSLLKSIAMRETPEIWNIDIHSSDM